MDNLNNYNDIFKDVFSVDESKLNSDFTKDNVEGWDSIHQLSLLTAIEDVFDVMFGTEEALSLTSYDAGKKILAEKFGVEF